MACEKLLNKIFFILDLINGMHKEKPNLNKLLLSLKFLSYAIFEWENGEQGNDLSIRIESPARWTFTDYVSLMNIFYAPLIVSICEIKHMFGCRTKKMRSILSFLEPLNTF